MSLKKIKQSIDNKKTITFDYIDTTGDGLSGKRIRVQPVACGISKAKNIVVRAWVKPPSVSFSGLKAKGDWRLFILRNMTNIKVNAKGWRVAKPGFNPTGDLGMLKVLFMVNPVKNK